ncbi:MAG: LTA synthase family protein [Prevotellaceae bacterium]|nr:LTA synthase family protein [Prevotellaceae bacterium]
MKRRLLFLLSVFAIQLPLLAVQKPVFMLYHGAFAAGYGFGDFMNVMLHGLKLDSTVSGYLTVVPLLFAIVSTWTSGRALANSLKVYFGLVWVVVAAVFAVDLALYGYWGFRIDATAVFYAKSPAAAFASVSAGTIVLHALIFAVYAFAGYKTLVFFALPLLPLVPTAPALRRVACTGVLLVAGAALFLPIRGSTGTSTANIGMVYFGSDRFLNHSAINPVFALMASLSKQQDFESQFDFFPEDERKRIFDSLTRKGRTEKETELPELPKLLNLDRPDILIILAESFSAGAVGVTGGEPDVTPNLNRLSAEGVLFANLYAGSFRTDRGIVAALNGYPAQPTTSIMKYPAKSQSLPSISRTLVDAGYLADALYGGDINFTNMKSYFFSAGFTTVVSDKDFPFALRQSKWGVSDDVTFRHLLESLTGSASSAPRLTVFLTLSSHEPFEVPFRKFDNPYLNSVAFTDDCFGKFIDALKQTPLWEKLLVVLVSDHGFRYPDAVQEFEPARFHIPMLWLGGALREPRRVETIASQTDLAATLLGQLGFDHRDFAFSKDIFDPESPRHAWYSFHNGFGFIDSTGISIFDNESASLLADSPPDDKSRRLNKGKALLQTLYDDLGKR